MYVCMHVCMYVCMHVCMYVCINVCMYVCMHVCMHACMHVMYVCNVCMYDMYVWRKATGSVSYLAWSSSQRALPERGFGGEALGVCLQPPLLNLLKKVEKANVLNCLAYIDHSKWTSQIPKSSIFRERCHQHRCWTTCMNSDIRTLEHLSRKALV